MLYLGQVIKLKPRQIQIQILAIRGNNGLWIPHQEIITKTLVWKSVYHTNTLVLIQLDSNREIIGIEYAASEIVRYLVEAYNKLAAIEAQKAEFAEWRYSLEYQGIELKKREQAITNREALLVAKEKKIEEILKLWRKQQEKN